MMKQLLTTVIVLASCCVVHAEENGKEMLPAAAEGKTWKLAWSDEFDGDTLDETKWETPPDGRRRDDWWMRKAISLDGKGHLVLTALKEDDRRITGCIRSRGKFEHTFGYYVILAQLQNQPGHWPAFWLQCDGVMSIGNEGRDGTEIDIFEKPWLDDRVNHAIHWDGYGKELQSVAKIVESPGVMEGWHTFGLWWKPDEYIFYVDGKETWRTNAGGVSQVPQFIKISDEIGKWAGDINEAKLPDHFHVDYVRVYDMVDQ